MIDENLKFLFLLCLFSLSSCLQLETDCCDYLNSRKVGEMLFIEQYRTFCAGVGGELTEVYLTDSTSFIKLIGMYDENEMFRTVIEGDTVKAILMGPVYSNETIENPKMLGETLEVKTFNINELQKQESDSRPCADK